MRLHMSYLRFRSLPFVLFAIYFALVLPGAGGQEKKLKELQWSHAYDLPCRKKDEKDITEKTQRFGVEAFRDKNTGDGIGLFIAQNGSIGTGANFAGLALPFADADRKKPSHQTGLDMPARKAGVLEWKGAKVHGMEIFRDPMSDNWIYVTDQGNIATCNAKGQPGNPGRDPDWIHSVDLQVRKGGVKEWKEAAKFGIEVYKDGNTNNLVYVTENGFVACFQEVTEVKIPKGKAGEAPQWLHGLDLSCRRHDEKLFTKDTRKWGVEVFHDVTTHNLIFISETGSIAVCPAPADIKAPTAKAKEPVWTHGLNVKCRKHGEKDFGPDTKAFGAEVVLDENVNVTIYINELGNIAVMSAK
jgi:hypothetical protein